MIASSNKHIDKEFAQIQYKELREKIYKFMSFFPLYYMQY